MAERYMQCANCGRVIAHKEGLVVMCCREPVFEEIDRLNLKQGARLVDALVKAAAVDGFALGQGAVPSTGRKSHEVLRVTRRALLVWAAVDCRQSSSE